MRITQSQVSFNTQHSVEVQRRVEQSLTVSWTGPTGMWSAQGNRESDAPARAEVSASVSLERFRLGAGGPRAGQAPRVGPPVGSLNQADVETTDEIAAPGDTAAADRVKLQMLIETVERFIGRKLGFRSIEVFGMDEQGQSVERPPEASTDAANRPTRGFEFRRETTFREAEYLHFSAEGLVKTADGTTIALEVELSMSREFVERSAIDVSAGAARLKDPLVINFNAPAAQLTAKRVAFDIDADGETDQIAQLAPGSGYLALDRNGNARIDNGAELFGTATGDGFAELAAHDVDANEWIDANDPIYEGLRIWNRDEHGNDVLVTLGERGVGAIYLGRAVTPFQLKDGQNATDGVVRSTGIYLDENYVTRTVQQLDLTV